MDTENETECTSKYKSQRLVWRCELSRPDLPTSAFCMRRSASGGRTGSACAARHTPTLNALVGRSGRLSSHRHTRHDKTLLSASCLVCRCELDDCSERVQTSNFLSATVLSCRKSNSHRRSGRDTDKTVLSCLAWRCELALSITVVTVTSYLHLEKFNIRPTTESR